jgi:RimJ/RimL family protein N-acetyltransferase
VATYHQVSTPRLDLHAVTLDDVDGVHDLHADPRVWMHFPTGRHADRADSVRLVERIVDDWATTGLGYWAVHLRAGRAGGPRPGELVGVAGVRLVSGTRWNLYYRLAPAAQGLGLAGEASSAALAAANDVDSSLPVTAYLLEHNTASRRTAERAGLHLIWRGPDQGPDPEAVRLVYADRAVAPALLAEMTQAG